MFKLERTVDIKAKYLTAVANMKYKNSSGDQIANVNVYAVSPKATRIR